MNEQSIYGKIGNALGTSPTAMPLPYDILRLFTSPQGYPVEIEHPGNHATPEQTTLEWLWVMDRSVTSLRPQHAHDDTTQVRNFREAQLQLEDIRALLVWPNGDRYVLLVCSMPALPAAQHQLIHNHLS